MFEISVKRKFRASHALRGTGGYIEDPHEHEWVCEITLSSPEVDASGMLADFRELDAVIDTTLAPFEGCALHEAEHFLKRSPSAENLARFIYGELKKPLVEKLARVKVWEDADHSATYYE
jgi:6-pyruvoyltetrahydropterin/6-carboxytetrahydropterin synthase